MKKICIAAIILCILLGGCSKKKETIEVLEPVGINIDTTIVTRRDIYNISTYNAHFIPYTEELCFSEEGYIGEIKVALGDTVKKGQVLATLDESRFKEEIESKQDTIAYLKKNNEYSNSLLEYDIKILEVELDQLIDKLKSSTEKKEVTELQLSIEVKKKDINLAKTKLSQAIELQEYELKKNNEELSNLTQGVDQTIIAPFSGEVVYITDSNMVTKDNVIITIADSTRLYLEMPFITENIIKQCNRYYALINNEEYAITYEPIDMENYNFGTDTTKFYLNEPNNTKLSVGDFVSICLINDYVKSALSVPNQVIYRDSSGDYVYLIKGDTKVRQPVSLGETTNIFTEIVDGLEEGDEVYVEN